MNIERKKGILRKHLNMCASCIFAVYVLSVVVTADKPVFCEEIIEIEHQAILAKKPDKIVSAGFWIPSKKQTAEALRAINKYLTELSKAEYSDMPRTTTQNSTAPTKKQISDIRKGLWKYRVQYMGIYFDNRKVIYCNFFMYDPKKYAKWKTEYVDVSVGGVSFWQIDYEEKTRQCTDLTINNEDLKAGLKQ